MRPDVVKHDWELTNAIERWEEKYRSMVLEGEGELKDENKRVALLSLEELGLAEAGLHQLQQAGAFACRDDSDLHHLPFAVAPNDLLAALVSTCSSERQPA